MSSLVMGDGEEEGNNACWRKEVLVLLVMVVEYNNDYFSIMKVKVN